MLKPNIERYYATGDDLEPDVYPSLRNLSSAMRYEFVPVPKAEPDVAETVLLSMPEGLSRDEYLLRSHFVSSWALSWESGHLRQDIWLSEELQDDVPSEWLPLLNKYENVNFNLLLLESSSRYPVYGPLYHLLPLSTLQRFGLPPVGPISHPLMVGWPFSDNRVWGYVFPADFERRIIKAFTYHMWPLLCPYSKVKDYSKDDPIRILANHLDFWLPYIDVVIRRRLQALGRCAPDDGQQAERLKKARTGLTEADDYTIERPSFGGHTWVGRDDAWKATKEMIDVADSKGKLRGILEAIRSGRQQDDFSNRWSTDREDFERSFFKKRRNGDRKVEVTFVELDDTMPVHGPSSEADLTTNLLWQDLFAVLDKKERRVVVCLRSGVTKAVEIAHLLGYANHSPVSKALARIRVKAERLLLGYE